MSALPIVLMTSGVCAMLTLIIAILVIIQIANRRKEPDRSKLFGSTIKHESPKYTWNDVPKEHVLVQPEIHNKIQAEVNEYRVISKPATATVALDGLSSQTRRWTSIDSETLDQAAVTTTTVGSVPHDKWQIWFKMEYNAEESTLKITIFRTKCYPESHVSEPSTKVYVSVLLLPDEFMQHTQPYANNGSPSFDESFDFTVPLQNVGEKQVRLSLYDTDNSKTRICLGHTLVTLNEHPMVQQTPVYLSRELIKLSEAMHLSCEQGPNVHLSLMYSSEKERLKVQILDAQDTPLEGESTQYNLRLQVLLGTKSVKTKRGALTHSLSDALKCSYAFQIPMKHLDTCCLYFTVIQNTLADNAESSNERVYSTLMVGPIMYTHGSGVDHWKQMMQNISKPVDKWHQMQLASTAANAKHTTIID